MERGSLHLPHVFLQVWTKQVRHKMWGGVVVAKQVSIGTPSLMKHRRLNSVNVLQRRHYEDIAVDVVLKAMASGKNV